MFVEHGRRMMRRQLVALTVWVVLCAPLLPVAARAGGGPLSQPAFHTLDDALTHGGFLSQSAFRPPGAFGSPGGYPFPQHHQDRLARVPPKHFPQRMPSHAFTWFPSTIALYVPSALYEPLVDTSSQAVSASPIIYVSSTVYVAPPMVSSPPVPAAVAPPPVPPLPSVVEYPTGRYELRGDGVATPYVWVWIPNPPPAPPAAPPPSPEEPRAGAAPSAMRSKIYQWTDDEGTTFWTNRVESIPEPQRSRAQRADQAVAQP